MEKKLSETESQILEIIKSGIKKNGYSPTRQEIADKLKIKKNGRVYVNVMLLRMKKKGVISLSKNGWRNIRIK